MSKEEEACSGMDLIPFQFFLVNIALESKVKIASQNHLKTKQIQVPIAYGLP